MAAAKAVDVSALSIGAARVRRARIVKCSSSDAAAINPIAGGPLSTDAAIGHFNSSAAGYGDEPAFAVTSERLLARRAAPVKSSDGFRWMAAFARTVKVDRTFDRGLRICVFTSSAPAMAPHGPRQAAESNRPIMATS
jgi:hypothetical protein